MLDNLVHVSALISSLFVDETNQAQWRGGAEDKLGEGSHSSAMRLS